MVSKYKSKLATIEFLLINKNETSQQQLQKLKKIQNKSPLLKVFLFD